MSRLWTKHICNESLVSHQYPYIFSLDPIVYTPPPWISFVHFGEANHCLWVITVLQVVLPMSVLVSCFCSKVVITHVSFYVELLHESNQSWTSVSMILTLCLISSFWFGARVGWCGMHQCPPSNGLAPSTSTHYLGLRLETYIVPWSLQSLVAGFSSLSIVGLHYCLLIDRFYKWLNSNKSICPSLECIAGTSMLIIIID